MTDSKPKDAWVALFEQSWKEVENDRQFKDIRRIALRDLAKDRPDLIEAMERLERKGDTNENPLSDLEYTIRVFEKPEGKWTAEIKHRNLFIDRSLTFVGEDAKESAQRWLVTSIGILLGIHSR